LTGTHPGEEPEMNAEIRDIDSIDDDHIVRGLD
jgi:hypothetical protein